MSKPGAFCKALQSDPISKTVASAEESKAEPDNRKRKSWGNRRKNRRQEKPAKTEEQKGEIKKEAAPEPAAAPKPKKVWNEDQRKAEIAALVSQVPSAETKSLKSLVDELTKLAEIKKPLPPMEQYQKMLSSAAQNLPVPGQVIDIIWQHVPAEEKQKLEENYQQSLRLYKSQMKTYLEKVNKLREIIGLPPLKYKLRRIKYPNPFRIFKKERMIQARKTNPDVKAKDIMPKIKEEWAALGATERQVYELYSQKEKENAIHADKMAKLKEQIESLKIGAKDKK